MNISPVEKWSRDNEAIGIGQKEREQGEISGVEAGLGRGRQFMESKTKMVHMTQMVTWKLTKEGKRDKE